MYSINGATHTYQHAPAVHYYWHGDFGYTADKVSAFSAFSRRETNAEVYLISRDGSSLRRIWLISSFLFKECKPVCREPQNSRTAFHCRCCWPARLETSNAAFHRRRNTVLYVAHAVCILTFLYLIGR